MLSEQLNHLTPAELIILEEHLKLGPDHLKHHLSDAEFKELLSSQITNKKLLKELQSNETEISGNLSLILNSVFASTFGAWMGFSGFWKLSLGKPVVFTCIVIFAAIVGAFVGYQTVQLVKKNAKGAIQKELLRLLQLEILKKLEEKRAQEITSLNKSIQHHFLLLSNKTKFAKENTLVKLDLLKSSKSQAEKWIKQLEAILEEKISKPRFRFLRDYYHYHLQMIQSELASISHGYTQGDQDLKAIHPKEASVLIERIDSHLFKLVTTSPVQSPPAPSWFKQSFRNIFVNLIPTILGGMGSVFVYIGGIPQILKSFGYEETAAFFLDPTVKLIETWICVLVIGFFGFAFVYNSYKGNKRQHALEKADKLIVQKESFLTVLDAQMLKIKEIEKQLSQLEIVFKLKEKKETPSDA